jgi:hypothetical protein
VKYRTETERTKSWPQCPAELFYIFISPCFTPTYTWLIFEVKTSLGAPHTFYSRAVN